MYKFISPLTILALVFSIAQPLIFLSVPLTARAVSTTIVYGTDIKDSWVDQNNTDENHGDDDELKVKSKDNSDNRRSLIAFSLPSLPFGAVVQSATFKLYMNNAPSSSRIYETRRILADWVEGNGGDNNDPAGEVRWNNKPAASSTATATVSSGTSNDLTLSWDVTTDVLAFYSGSANNYGWVIQDQNESNQESREAKFRSKEHGTVSQRPILEITYLIVFNGSISGQKWNDNNAGGSKDGDEAGIADWTINLYQGATLVTNTTTDASGNYSFNNLASDNFVYIIKEKAKFRFFLDNFLLS